MTKRIEELELQIGQDDETLNWENIRSTKIIFQVINKIFLP